MRPGSCYRPLDSLFAACRRLDLADDMRPGLRPRLRGRPSSAARGKRASGDQFRAGPYTVPPFYHRDRTCIPGAETPTPTTRAYLNPPRGRTVYAKQGMLRRLVLRQHYTRGRPPAGPDVSFQIPSHL